MKETSNTVIRNTSVEPKNEEVTSPSSVNSLQETENNLNNDSEKKLRGYLGRCDENGIFGWIIDGNNPHEHVKVDVFIDDELIARTTADIFRQDLLDNGIGNGEHGFHIPMPTNLFDNLEHKVEIKDVLTGLLLEECSKFFMLEPVTVSKNSMAQASEETSSEHTEIVLPKKNLKGSLDICDERGIAGWAVDNHNPNQPMTVDIFIDGELIIQTTANLIRKDLLGIGIGDGRCGFNVSMPDEFFDGNEHIAEVRDALTGLLLSGITSKPFLLSRHETLLKNYNKALQREDIKLVKCFQQLLDVEAQQRFECYTEGFHNTSELYVWLRDKTKAKEIPTLELLSDETVIVTAKGQKNLQKPDFARFIFTLPEQFLDGTIHTFTFRVKEWHGHLGKWHFITPTLSTQSSNLEGLLWKNLPASKLAEKKRAKKKSVKADWEQKLENLADVISNTDKDDKEWLCDLLCQQGQILLEANKPEEALEKFQQAMAIESENVDAVIACANTLITLGRENDAENVVNIALKQSPKESSLLELIDKLTAAKRPKASKILAFYLPQFHPIPENDQWWGRGFTEWTNVAAATPLFSEHLQPRRPTNLGYYDLRLPESANAQFDLARRYGIDGFCYYYYWFNGKRVLERPLQDLVDGKTGPFPFCICWANEDWTRSWDGASGEVLLAQNHTFESDFEFIKDVTPLLKHPDYVRVDGKPVLLIYCANKLTTPKKTVEAWRNWCIEQGIGELHLCAVQSFGFDDPRPFGFDAAVEFPPHCPHDKYPELNYRQQITVTGLVDNFAGHILSYEAFANAALNRPREPYTLHRSCFLAWDNAARRNKSATVFHNFTAWTYQQWLATITAKNANEQQTGLTFINAWNEWAEGTVLEPDAFFGYELLERTYQTKALINYAAHGTYWKHGRPLFHFDRIEASERILLIGHDAHFNGAQITLLNMARCLQRELSMQIVIVLIEGGVLLPDYERIGTTLVLGQEEGWKNTFIDFIRHYSCFGTNKAITNTVGTGDIVELLHQQNYRVVSLVHELPALIESYNLQAACWRIAGNADNIVFASKIVADSFCDRYWPDPKKVLVAPQGVLLNPYHHKRDLIRTELRKDLGFVPDAKIIIGCGYGDTRKGVDLFVQMAGEVTRLYSEENIAFVWVGDLEHSIKPYVLADIKRLQLNESFHITGKSNDHMRYFIASDVFALTSREDPFPNVVMEAFDAKLPVVAFNGGGGYVDIVNDNTGALVPYLDVGAMSSTILMLLKNDDLRQQIGEHCHKLCRELFTYEPYMRKLLALLNNVPAEQVATGALKRQAWLANETPRPTISVIVPNYNYGRYLELRLRSILDQTLAPTEIIILDDASTDYSLELIAAIVQQSTIPIHIVTNETNTGNTFVQWAKGLELAQGELVWIAEADDYCEPTLLETLAKEFVDESISMAWVDSIMVDDNGRSSGFEYKNYYAKNHGDYWQTHFQMNGQDLIDKCLLVENVIPNASAVLFRRQAVSNDLSMIKNYRFAGDWWFWITIAQTGNVVYHAETLNYHRRHSLSVMGEVLREGEKLLPEMMQFYQRIAEYKPECLTKTVKLQILERLETLYQLFPKLQEIAPQLIEHPDFSTQYQQLETLFNSEQFLIETYTKMPATVVISEDVMADRDIVFKLLHYLAHKNSINLVLLVDAENIVVKDDYEYIVNSVAIIELNPKRIVSKDTKVKTQVIATPVEQLAQLLNQSGYEQLITFGLLAHCLTESIVDNKVNWVMVAGNEFNSLLGKLPEQRDVSLSKLKSAFKKCHQAQFITAHSPHAFARMAQLSLVPLESLTLEPVDVIKLQQSYKTRPVRFLGIASGVSVETWQTVAQVLQEVEKSSECKTLLRLLAWDADIVQLRQGLKNEKNVEVVAVFEKPRDFSELGEIGVVIQTEKEITGSLILDFKRCGMQIVDGSKINNKEEMLDTMESFNKSINVEKTCLKNNPTKK